MTLYIILGIILIIFILISFFMISRFDIVGDLINKIERSKNNISNTLDKKIDLMNQIQKVLESDYKIEAFNINIKSLDKDYDLELDKNVDLIESKLVNEINKLDNIKSNKKISTIRRDIKEIDNDILGLKEYYNLYIDDYNKLFDNFFYKFILKIKKKSKLEKFSVKNTSELQILKD